MDLSVGSDFSEAQPVVLRQRLQAMTDVEKATFWREWDDQVNELIVALWEPPGRERCSLADVDPDELGYEEAERRFEAWQLWAAAVRIHEGTRHMWELGILDKRRESVSKQLPPDIREGSDTDLDT